MRKITKFISKVNIVLFLLIPFTATMAYETEWDDPKFKDKKGDEETLADALMNSKFKIDGVIFGGYEFLDRDVTGTPESGGKDKTGFSVTRTYINLSSTVTEGEHKGWGFRLTPDIERREELCDTSVCDGKNSYVMYMKYAYVNIPLLNGGKTSLRIGQQQVPAVSGKAGVDFTKLWGHRYLSKVPLQQLGLTESVDIGASLIHKSDYFGVHLLLSNGEGYHHANAENLNQGNLVSLSEGSDDSYGYDLNGLVSIIPFGKTKDFQWSINLPFREENIIGMDTSEYTVRLMDVSNLANPTFSYYRSSTRAKKDAFYALDTDFVMKFPSFEMTVGLGRAQKKDRRANSYLIDETVIDGVNPADIATISSHMVVAEDRTGIGNYGYIHFKVDHFGGVFRYMEGTGGSSLSDKMSTTSNQPLISRVINEDAQDGILGNMEAIDILTLDQGKAKFKSILAGLTYHANDRFDVTLGFTRVTGIDSSGRSYRTNIYENITDGAGNTVAEQLESNPAVIAALGLSGVTSSFDLNDLVGKKKVISETFVRAQYKF